MKNNDIEKLNLEDWPVSNQYLIEVGRIPPLWASLESLLNLCIGKLAGFDDREDPKAFILINHSSFPQRLDILSTLCEQIVYDFPNLKNYKQIVKKLKTAQKGRNKYTHNPFSYNAETNKIEMPIGSARGSLKVKVETITLADIKRVSIEIDEAQCALYSLIFQQNIEPVWKRKNL
jgi:hypothetical protein